MESDKQKQLVQVGEVCKIHDGSIVSVLEVYRGDYTYNYTIVFEYLTKSINTTWSLPTRKWLQDDFLRDSTLVEYCKSPLWKAINNFKQGSSSEN